MIEDVVKSRCSKDAGEIVRQKERERERERSKWFIRCDGLNKKQFENYFLKRFKTFHVIDP